MRRVKPSRRARTRVPSRRADLFCADRGDAAAPTRIFRGDEPRRRTFPCAPGTCAAGPCWIWDPLRWAEDATGVVIRSVTFATENKNDLGPCGEDKLIPCAAGMHYCKGVSPARVLEWIYTDSLRNATSSSWHLSSVA